MARRSRAIAAVAAGVLVMAGAAPAFADAPDGAGWWSATNQGLSSPAPPDVPPGGLLVQGLSGDANGHQAIGGIRIVLGGRNVEALVLAIEAAGPTPPSVAACRAEADWEPTANGDWGSRPVFDCSDAIAGEADDDGAMVFPGVGALQEDGVLSLALVPTAPTRVVFGAPGDATFYVPEPRPAADEEDGAEDAGEGPAADPAPASSTSGRDTVPGRTGSHVVASSGPRSSASQDAADRAPAPVVAPEAVEDDEPLSSGPIELGSGLRRSTNAAPTGPGDRRQRGLTALALLAVLGPYVARLSPGGGRLRPARVPWERAD